MDRTDLEVVHAVHQHGSLAHAFVQHAFEPPGVLERKPRRCADELHHEPVQAAPFPQDGEQGGHGPPALEPSGWEGAWCSMVHRRQNAGAGLIRP